MYETQFLKDIALQNYTKYNIDVTDWLPTIRFSISGKMYIVNRRFPDDVLKISTSILGHWQRFGVELDNRVVAHLPVHVETSGEKDMIVSISQLINPIGIVGIDMYLSDIAEDVIYYKYQDSYAFLVDKNGYAIMHPTYPRPRSSSSSSSAYRFPTDIKYLEQMTGFSVVRKRMLTETSGSETISGERDGIPKSVIY